MLLNCCSGCDVMKNYYQTLGISKHSTEKEIKKAYRELALRYHPDKNRGSSELEQFKEINEAKEVLLDEFKKFHYDCMLFQFLSKRKRIWRFKGVDYSFSFHNIQTNHFNIKSLLAAVLFSVVTLMTSNYFENSQKDVEGILEELKDLNSLKEKEPLEATALVLPFRRTKKKAQKPPRNIKIENRKPITRVTIQPERKKIIGPSATAVHNSGIRKPNQRQLTNDEMIQIVHNIKTEKEKSKSNSNCVQIIKTKTSNIQNAFDLADLLRSYGFIISGRETSFTSSNGITIDAKSDCIRVTFGTF